MNGSQKHTTQASSPRIGGRWLIVMAAAASLLVWYVPGGMFVAYPLKLFVTYVHEGGHAVATILTGGSVDHIAIQEDTSGVTLSQGGSMFLIPMAGYLGAMLYGASMILLTRRRGTGRMVLMAMAGTVAVITLLWTHNGFGFLAGLLIAGAVFAASFVPAPPITDFLASFLAVQLCLNALYDVRDLVWLSAASRTETDAAIMTKVFGLTPWFWAISWAAIALLILTATLRTYWRTAK